MWRCAESSWPPPRLCPSCSAAHALPFPPQHWYSALMSPPPRSLPRPDQAKPGAHPSEAHTPCHTAASPIFLLGWQGHPATPQDLTQALHRAGPHEQSLVSQDRVSNGRTRTCKRIETVKGALLLPVPSLPVSKSSSCQLHFPGTWGSIQELQRLRQALEPVRNESGQLCLRHWA